MTIKSYNDPMGQAILDKIRNKAEKEITILSPDFANDIITVDYLFRSYPDMPTLEKKALDHAKGRTLDAGAGAGSHALYLQEKGLDVTAIDTSPGAVEGMRARGIKKAMEADIFILEHQRFDTIFLLMNGIGLAGTPQGYIRLLEQLKKLLSPTGAVYFDTSDIRYLFDKPIPKWQKQPNDNYYGIVPYQMKYKQHISPSFNWLYIDENMAEKLALESGYMFEIILRDEHYGYLARLIKK
ncbi:MAG: class I SAM-dependent methyltransferase [Bacteroidota bacterium]